MFRALLLALLALLPGACRRAKSSEAAPSPAASADRSAGGATPISSLRVDHGELDTRAPSNAARLAATVIAATIYKLPNVESRKLGYMRLGGSVERDPEPVAGPGCGGKWYRVYPMGYVCSDEATTDLEQPLVRASRRRPDLSKPMPYSYGFVRATTPLYLRVPSRDEQLKSEFKLEEHLSWYEQNRSDVQAVVAGANDVPLDARGMPRVGAKPAEGQRLATELSLLELFGATSPKDPIPFWLEGGRKVRNISGFEVPEYAIFADRARRKTGLSFVGAFEAEDAGFKRAFGVLVDLRLVPLTKVKPDTGSPFHGIELTDAIPIPFAWVIKRESLSYRLIKDKDEAKPGDALPRRAIVPLTGNARIKQGKRFYQTLKDKTLWLQGDDIAIVAKPQRYPEVADKGEKWIDISLRQQTLVLYEGKRAVYATLVSTGRDRLGDPKDSLATPQGNFRLRSKHIAAAMDSYENSAVAGGTRANTGHTLSESAESTAERLKQAEADGQRLGEDDQRRLLNLKKGRDPEYGVTKRRGSENFELRDVPWIQYFASGYAIHGAYWHDVFGIPRSHGCVNLSPLDARVVFAWSDPPVPEGWHGLNVGPDMGEGTAVVVRE